MASRFILIKKLLSLLYRKQLFVAMLENPVKNNPYRNPEKAKARRNVVLDQMQKTGYIDQATFEKAISTPIEVDFHPIKNITDGYSAYYKFYLEKK
jgi:penicillin-binding protein 1A